MKKLDPYKANQLTQLISTHYPNQSIMLISDGSCDLHQTLYAFTMAKNFEFDLLGVEWECNDLSTKKYPRFSHELIDLGRRQFNKHGRKYDNLYVTLSPDMLASDTTTILKKIYRIMKNAGIVTFLIEKEAQMALEMEKYLEDGYFVAINRIDIFDDYEVVTAKKLHGWGAYDVGF